MEDLLNWLSSLTFIVYGILCLTTNNMKSEFERFGMSKYRKLTGVLELLGGIGAIVGFKVKVILLISTAGLGVLMLLGTLTRLKIKDPLIDIVPAASLMVINFYILYRAIY